MFFGVQYYPEQWPESRWPIDAAMMQRAGVNTVRMGEFAWSAYEPREGEIDFRWMDCAIQLLNDHGIRVILCTCSRTPPWVFKKYPGVANTRADGQLNRYGQRYTVGLAHPEFIALAERMDRAVVEHFAGHPGIIGWQVDNEVGGFNDCYRFSFAGAPPATGRNNMPMAFCRMPGRKTAVTASWHVWARNCKRSARASMPLMWRPGWPC
jgi:beta-galactosidase GanA